MDQTQTSVMLTIGSNSGGESSSTSVDNSGIQNVVASAATTVIVQNNSRTCSPVPAPSTIVLVSSTGTLKQDGK